MHKRIISKFTNLKLRLPILIPGLGCGVLGMALPKVSLNLGAHASKLLKALEYRGYDSTGAAFLGDDPSKITLLKDVGAPSTLVKTLGIEKQSGKIFCGQVRWATFGFVNKVNAQPHEVKCKRHIFGAHNGNITNTRELKVFLTKEGHTVLSDNDGEMLVHSVEHYFDIEMRRNQNPIDPEARKACMRQAIIQTAEKMNGSYAAVIVDPETQCSWAIKAGSSLYFGVGEVDDLPFCLASSDLTAVLRFTKMLVNLREGEFVEYTSDTYQVYALRNLKFKRLNQPNEVYSTGSKINTRAVYSKLRAEDVELLPEFEYFMEQEIYAQSESTGKLIKLFQGGSNTGKSMLKIIDSAGVRDLLTKSMLEILGETNPESKLKRFDDLCASKTVQDFYASAQKDYSAIFDVAVKEDFDKKYFFSNEKNIFIELMGKEYDQQRLIIAKALDSISEQVDVSEFEHSVQDFLSLIKNTISNNRNAYSIACGTSFHATKIAALFFNEIAKIELIPILPGDFRGEYSYSIKDNDLIIGVSQSGETKDLIDIFNDIDSTNLDVRKVVLVNNMNSTLGQEKSDVAIPILCGPEIAVPATKSFMNQITLFYYLAIRIADMKLKELDTDLDPNERKQRQEMLVRRFKSLADIPMLLKETVVKTDDMIDSMAAKIYMEPSLHILATKISGVAMEGALKIRETVLNHAEGREASEFKHGPNTILGKNTVFGVKHVRSFVRSFSQLIDDIDEQADAKGISAKEQKDLLKALADYVFTHNMPFNLSAAGTELFNKTVQGQDFFEPLYRNYPLIYVTGPDERDVNLTISQINTHKIRGSNTYVIAEENEHLLKNASLNPNEAGYYHWAYVMLPKTGDSLMTCFSATIVLQLLALRMSIRKMKKLDLLGVKDHGVHPDVPKNVSKSITVD
ncbi:MAG: SIS domain-containing protein [Candidatus Cloacimonetes bacterium]|nr:SIS domain-containing protein [Candidatus Cloacimonadota bacterium]MDD3096459.1 SIS domain-containing protein [Candidatus Cloacimonadota bacterium]MDD4666897.1 SIS domain-containing protein [Candidatus Cloacimonadota bacterium]